MATDPGSYAPPPKKTNWLLWIGCGGLLVVVLGCVGFIALCGGASWLGFSQLAKMEQRVIDEPGTPVDAVELSKNPSAYEDKVVLVTGTVKSKTADNEIELAGAPGGETIKCQAGLKQMLLFNSVSVGDNVTVKGLVQGHSLGSVSVVACQNVTKNSGSGPK